ncbi:MAG: helix-turn-helix domain-containing protein [Planctomycetes bacterium]|nr:helix-turn-helix domain-containing protein [Planctomycetota bacterium]
MQPFREAIVPSRNQSFAYRRFTLPSFPFRWHIHPEAELTLIVRGRGMRYVGDDLAEFREGDLVLLAGGLPHTWSTRARSGRSVESIVVQFLPESLGIEGGPRPETRAIHRMLQRATRGLAFRGRAARKAAQSMREMADLAPLPRLLRLLETLDRLAATRQARPLSTRVFSSPLQDRDRTRIDRVCRALENRYTEPLTLDDAARIARLHPASFARFFKRTTGQTFVEYLHRLRVGHASRLLSETDRPITDICFQSGFGNVSNFNRVFRRLRGTTPRAYRAGFSAQPGSATDAT